MAYRRAYRAATGFTDHLVGKLLDALEAKNLTHNTTVLLMADHGWSLGEHGQWCKQSNTELVVRIPLVVRAPWLAKSLGRRVDHLVEAVDVFPTLLDLHGVTIPETVGSLEGTSFAPMLRATTAPAPTKNASFSQYPRCFAADNTTFDPSNQCTKTDASAFGAMGYSIRTQEWRYTRWVRWDGHALRGLDNKLVGEELYAHAGDDGEDNNLFENANLAGDPQYADVVATLHKALLRGWRAARL